jgi:hypothetical protein
MSIIYGILFFVFDFMQFEYRINLFNEISFLVGEIIKKSLAFHHDLAGDTNTK